MNAMFLAISPDIMGAMSHTTGTVSL